MNDIDLGPLEDGPHANLIRYMARKCAADGGIQAVWVGGSLAIGLGDQFSDVDFRIAVHPEDIDRWTNPDWDKLLPLRPCGHQLLRFDRQALLHHLILSDGTIVDFYVQDTAHQNFEPELVVLVCRDAAFKERLMGFARPAAALEREIDAVAVRQLVVDYWITTHKQMKALARRYDHSAFAGLYLERMALLRAWYMQATGKEIDPRITLHMLGKLNKGLDGTLAQHQHDTLGLPTRTPDETAMAIEAVRAEMSLVGHWLAERYQFEYPQTLEDVVRQTWNDNKEILVSR